MWRRSLSAFLILTLMFFCTVAHSHTRSESHTNWIVDGRVVRATVTFPDLEGNLLGHGNRPTDADVIAYITPRLGVLASGQPCRLTAPGHTLESATGYRRSEYTFDCQSDKDFVLRFDGFFELVPTHVDFAQIQFSGGEVVEQLFTQEIHQFDLSEGQGGKLKDAGFLQFVKMGVMHIFTGIDHMSFLLGLVLISRKLKDLIFVVSGFTLGHSITLALAVTGILRPHGQFIDALVALTIALVGVENIVVSLDRPSKLAFVTGGLLLLMAALSICGYGVLPPMLLLGVAIFSAAYLLIAGHLHESGRLRMVVTTIFGLIHGFGFAADLLEARIPSEKLVQILFGFNIGVEIGQLAVVAAITAFVWTLRRIQLATPRPITVDVVGSALVAEGLAWFISRSFV